MELPRFLLNDWLMAHEYSRTPVRFDLAASTGSPWTVGEVLSLGNGLADFGNIALSYTHRQGHPALREAIGAFHGVDPDWIVVTTGASEAMSIVLCLAARPNANVILPTPAYAAFDAMTVAWALRTLRYRLRRDDGFKQRCSDVLEAIDDDSVMAIVNTPHNPTGAVMPHGEIVSLAAELAQRGIPLVVDEVYHPLYFGTPQPSAASLDNVIAICDMSKALSLPGLRVGWVVDANAERRGRLIDARSSFTISNSPVSEAIAAHALTHRDALLRRFRDVATANLSALADFMRDVDDVLSWVRPKGGSMAFPWFQDGRNSRSFCERTAKAGVLIAPGDCFGASEHMRIGFGAQAAGFSDALTILRRALREGLSLPGNVGR